MARSSAPGLLIACAVLIGALFFAFSLGRYPVGVGDLFEIIAAKIFGYPSDLPAAAVNVIFQVRGPRVVIAVLVGAALAVAGTAFQGLFRNPLVSPDLLGASSGAALGAVLGIYLSLGVFAIQVLAFVGGLAAVAAVVEAQDVACAGGRLESSRAVCDRLHAGNQPLGCGGVPVARY